MFIFCDLVRQSKNAVAKYHNPSLRLFSVITVKGALLVTGLLILAACGNSVKTTNDSSSDIGLTVPSIPDSLLSPQSTAIASAQESRSVGLVPSASTHSASSSSTSLPLDSYDLANAADQQTLVQASQVAVRECMAKLGFHDSTPLASGKDQESAPSVQRSYGITDLDAARENGYTPVGAVRITTLPTTPSQPGYELTIPAQLAEHGRAWVIAMYGAVPPDPAPKNAPGCIDADASLGDEAWRSVDRDLVTKLRSEADQRTQTDSRVLAVNAQWSTCMAKHGYTYANPSEPMTKQWPNPVSSTEKATAVQDVECKQQTNLPAIWLAVQAGYEQQLIDHNAVQLQQWQEAFRHEIELAAASIASYSSQEAVPSSSPTR